MLKTLHPGIQLREVPGVFHSMPGFPTHAPGFIVLLDSRGVPWTRDSGPTGPSAQPQWQYVNVKRVVVFIEQSLAQGCQWAVFQNNGPSLWSRVVNSMEQFLAAQWLQGSLKGSKRHQAYFVRCDSSTMSQEDLATGRVVVLVGFAPLKPAEFVVIQIGIQTTKK